MRHKDGRRLTLQERFFAVKDDDLLCCCEYINESGEKSHILACCCDCEAVDLAFERLITCRGFTSDGMNRIIDTLIDRCRIPACFGSGAIKVRFDVVLPVVLIPALWFVASWGPWYSVFALAFAVVLLAFVHSTWRRRFRARRTKFFFSWAMMSVFCLVYVFETVIVALREILLWENLVCVTLGGAILYCIYLCKASALKHETSMRDRLSMEKPNSAIVNNRKFRSVMYSGEDGEEVMKVTVEEDDDDDDDDNNMQRSMTSVDSSDNDVSPYHNHNSITQRPSNDENVSINWCDDCKHPKKLRSGHCTVCNVCIDVRDHHCVWLDCCIGEHNHRSFFMCMILCVVLGVYGCHISLTSICTPEMFGGWFLYANDCRFLYADIRFASAFVGIVYTVLGTAIILCGVIVQSIFISQNITQQEYHKARNTHGTKCQFVAYRTLHNYGVLRNWRLFISGRRSFADDHVV